jgi:hypothetical protein
MQQAASHFGLQVGADGQVNEIPKQGNNINNPNVQNGMNQNQNTANAQAHNNRNAAAQMQNKVTLQNTEEFAIERLDSLPESETSTIDLTLTTQEEVPAASHQMLDNQLLFHNQNSNTQLENQLESLPRTSTDQNHNVPLSARNLSGLPESPRIIQDRMKRIMPADGGILLSLLINDMGSELGTVN